MLQRMNLYNMPTYFYFRAKIHQTAGYGLLFRQQYSRHQSKCTPQTMMPVATGVVATVTVEDILYTMRSVTLPGSPAITTCL